jgi:hypothetical protein
MVLESQRTHSAMTLSPCNSRFLRFAVVGLVVVELLPEARGFQISHPTQTIASKASPLWMGLYDDSLPPRPSPLEKEPERGDDEDDDDDIFLVSSSPRLFSLRDDGTERQNLLPPLGLRLDLGMDCNFEPTDGKVQNLADQTSCHPWDAAWALEACKGDLVEAKTRIMVAQRLALEQVDVAERTTCQADSVENDDEISVERSPDAKNNSNNDGGGVSLDAVKADLYDRMQQDEWEEMTEQRRNEQRRNAFRWGEKDTQWLPGKENPRPIEDEPWFTG